MDQIWLINLSFPLLLPVERDNTVLLLSTLKLVFLWLELDGRLPTVSPRQTFFHPFSDTTIFHPGRWCPVRGGEA
jgi:hypothetical protein